MKTSYLAVFVLLLLALGMWCYHSGKGGAGALASPASAATSMTSGVTSTAGKISGSSSTKMGTVVPTDLLPADNNASWAKLNPSLSGSGPILGDTVSLYGKSTRVSSFNPNMQLRSDPEIIPQKIGFLEIPDRNMDKFRPNIEITA